MAVKEKVGVFNYKSGNSQGILIREVGMNPIIIIDMQMFFSSYYTSFAVRIV